MPESEIANLLHFFVIYLEREFPSLLTVAEEMKAVSLAASLSTSGISQEVAELRSGLKEAESSLEVLDDGPDPFKRMLTSFLKKAKEEFSFLESAFSRLVEDGKNLAGYFNEDSVKVPPEEILSQISKFVESLTKTYASMIEERANAEKEKRRLQLKVERVCRCLSFCFVFRFVSFRFRFVSFRFSFRFRFADDRAGG